MIVLLLTGNNQSENSILNTILRLRSSSQKRIRGSEVDFILLIGNQMKRLIRLLDESGIFGDRSIVSLLPSMEVRIMKFSLLIPTQFIMLPG